MGQDKDTKLGFIEQSFLAYYGDEFSENKLTDELNKFCTTDDDFVCKTCENSLKFAKIVAEDDFVTIAEPYRKENTGNLTIGSYNKKQIAKAAKSFGYDINFDYYTIVNDMYSTYDFNVFKKLGDYMDFCAVIFDKKSGKMIAGVTDANSEHTHLYYGYTKKNMELMYSNNKEMLELFCKEIKEMPTNTYMKDGEFHEFSVEKKDEKKFPDLTIDVLKNLLGATVDENVKAKIEKIVTEYLASDDSKESIIDIISNEIDSGIQKQVLTQIKEEIEKGNIKDTLKAELDHLFSDYTSKIQAPVVHIIDFKDTVLGQVQSGFYHEKFEQILTQVQLDEPIMLVGPAGSGKNVAIAQVAKALGQHMYYTNNISNEFKLSGFIDAGGNYRDTEFYKAFKNGGVFFLDEIDNSDPSALIGINSALANGYVAFPHETIDRHQDFKMIAAANTWGKGADLQYIGRNILDAATLDRFDNIFFDYDPKLEESLYPNEEVLEFMWEFRKAVTLTKIPHIVSTRNIGKVYKKEINGIPVSLTLESNIVRNLGQDDVNTIVGNMNEISDNKYYKSLKKLRLSR